MLLCSKDEGKGGGGGAIFFIIIGASQNIFSRYYYATAVSLINSIRDTAAVAVILNSINDHHQI